MVVCVTQMWLSMPTMMHESGPVAFSLSRAFFTSGVLGSVNLCGLEYIACSQHHTSWRKASCQHGTES